MINAWLSNHRLTDDMIHGTENMHQVILYMNPWAGKTGKWLLLSIGWLLFALTTLKGQKVVGDCTIHYGVTSGNDHGLDSNTLKNATKVFYVRGGMSLTEINFNNFSQSTIYNQNGDKAYVLYHLNEQNYMAVLTNKQWLKQYKRYKGMKVQFKHNDTKKILGYLCQKAIITLKDGSHIQLYYTPELQTTVCENPYEFEKINGLVLEYESQIGHKYNFTFTARKIDFNPVPAARFIIPKQGYRLLDPSQLRSED